MLSIVLVHFPPITSVLISDIQGGNWLGEDAGKVFLIKLAWALISR
jgi:hypothetical protein